MSNFWFWFNLAASLIVAIAISFGAVLLIALVPPSFAGAIIVGIILIGNAILVLALLIGWASWTTDRFIP